jgi:HSP20 family protein
MGLPAEAWRPAVNVYAYADRLEVCVDLAGVSKEDVDVRVEVRRLIVRGHRSRPERGCDRPPCGRILAMEIPDGVFERVLEFPWDVNATQAEARQDNGWLWISLPRTGE